MPVHFHNMVKVRLSDRNMLKSFIDKMVRKSQKAPLFLNIVFCSDAYLLDINKRFLNHDYYTDIITFNLSEPGTLSQAEIYISVDRVSENAKNQLVSFRNEIHRVIFHGVLHLLGYDDKSSKKKDEMTKMENRWLGLYFNSK